MVIDKKIKAVIITKSKDEIEKLKKYCRSNNRNFSVEKIFLLDEDAVDLKEFIEFSKNQKNKFALITNQVKSIKESIYNPKARTIEYLRLEGYFDIHFVATYCKSCEGCNVNCGKCGKGGVLNYETLYFEFNHASEMLRTSYDMLNKIYEHTYSNGALMYTLYNGLEKLLKCTMLYFGIFFKRDHNIIEQYDTLFEIFKEHKDLWTYEEDFLNLLNDFANTDRYKNLDNMYNPNHDAEIYGYNYIENLTSSTIMESCKFKKPEDPWFAKYDIEKLDNQDFSSDRDLRLKVSFLEILKPLHCLLERSYYEIRQKSDSIHIVGDVKNAKKMSPQIIFICFFEKIKNIIDSTNPR